MGALLAGMVTALGLLAACAAGLSHRAPARLDTGRSMVRFEGGRLRLSTGDEVAVGPFLIDTTEVTADAYAKCAAAGACATPGTGQLCTFRAPGKGNHPINCVSWEEARTYCAWARKRLPTEAEWEWAARGGGAARTYPWGDEPPTDQLCWDGEGNPLGKGGRVLSGLATCPVASHLRGDTPEGLHDMAGNVLEWTATAYRGEGRVTRGGRWFEESANQVATSYRRWSSRLFRDDALGFRCAMSE
jgi:formylglycine-generating enzyme required for sulfatase activity